MLRRGGRGRRDVVARGGDGVPGVDVLDDGVDGYAGPVLVMRDVWDAADGEHTACLGVVECGTAQGETEDGSGGILLGSVDMALLAVCDLVPLGE